MYDVTWFHVVMLPWITYWFYLISLLAPHNSPEKCNTAVVALISTHVAPFLINCSSLYILLP